MSNEYDYWNRQLDNLKRSSQLSTEVELSLLIGLSPAMLAHVRTGRRPLPFPAKAKLLDRLGYILTRDLMLRLLPDDAARTVIDIDNARLKRKVDEAGENTGRELPPLPTKTTELTSTEGELVHK